MKPAVTRDAGTDRRPGGLRFGITAQPLHLWKRVDPSRLHDFNAALEVETFKALTARLEQKRTQGSSRGAKRESAPM